MVIDRNAEVGENWGKRYDRLQFHVPTSNCEMPFLREQFPKGHFFVCVYFNNRTRQPIRRNYTVLIGSPRTRWPSMSSCMLTNFTSTPCCRRLSTRPYSIPPREHGPLKSKQRMQAVTKPSSRNTSYKQQALAPANPTSHPYATRIFTLASVSTPPNSAMLNHWQSRESPQVLVATPP